MRSSSAIRFVAFALAVAAAGAAAIADAGRELVVDRKLLAIPVRNGATTRNVTVTVDGVERHAFALDGAEDAAAAQWWASLDVSAFSGKTVTLSGDAPAGFFDAIEQVDAPKGQDDVYREPLRQQFHFSAKRGWLNDPNGLVYFGGSWHLFFQHNPYGVRSNQKHWGHATSPDLVRWTERDIALYPDAFGQMYSGSAVVDRDNTSGLGKDGRPPLVLIYTGNKAPRVQCIASSLDGLTFEKFAGNPVLPGTGHLDRDPKVIWHAPTQRWVMVLYVGGPTPEPGARRRDIVKFFTSPDLKAWTYQSEIEGLYECPDFFPLPLDGDASRERWVLTGANFDYFVGTFDGRTFAPETPKLTAQPGGGRPIAYAPQTFSDAPDGRRVAIAWLRTPTNGMPFSQSMSVPLELALVSTPNGPRLRVEPARELAALRDGPPTTTADVAIDGPVGLGAGELLEVRAVVAPGDAGVVTFDLRGLPVRYDVAARAWRAGGKSLPAAPRADGTVDLVAFVDRNSVELIVDEGRAFVPVLHVAAPDDRAVRVRADAAGARVVRASVHALKSAW